MLKPAVNVAVKAARAAGNVIVRNLDRVHSLDVTTKRRHDYASDVDRQAEQVIVRELRHAWPRCAIIGEEGGSSGPQNARQTWIIDPLDGTSNFLRGIPHFAVSIAMVEDGELQHAVIFDPVRNELFSASRGSGAQLNGRKLRVSERIDLDGALIATGFPFRQPEHLPAHLAMVGAVLGGAEDIRRAGSAALDLAWVACGRLDGFFEIGLAQWDIAAGALLVREAGGRCADFHNREDYMASGNIIAANIKVCDALYRAIEPEITPALLRS
jgi:myo-inositol-1(or 4)-monophosphatase